MGGPGSGRHFRFDRQMYVEDALPMDVRYLHRQGILEPGYHGTITWSYNEQPVFGVAVQTGANSITLRISLEDRERCLVIRIDHTPCTYGGWRPWFLCPECYRRCGLLYAVEAQFACRLCHGLPYHSQRCSDEKQLLAQVRKVREQTLAGPNMFELLRDEHKPKGMHWKTFDRLVERHDHYYGDLIGIWKGRLGI